MNIMLKSITRLIFLAIAVVIILFLIGHGFFTAVYYYTSTPEFCSSCHYLEPYVISWGQSPHKSVNCMVCHEATGVLGKFHSKARGLNYYLSDKTGNFIEPVIDATFINEKRCFGCHTGEIKDYPYVPKINKDKEHLKHINNEKQCSSCHFDVGHEINIGVEEVFKDVNE